MIAFLRNWSACNKITLIAFLRNWSACNKITLIAFLRNWSAINLVMSTKRKHKVLTVEEKLKICELVSLKVPYNEICSKYGIGRSTITDIKKKEAEFKAFVDEATGNASAPSAKAMKTSKFSELDAALFIWIRQMREKNFPVTGPLLSEKARQLFTMLYPNSNDQFTGSAGFISNFCRRHNLNNVSIQGEKVSADEVSALSFVQSFPNRIEGFNKHQIFNCDETGLNYKCLTKRTYILESLRESVFEN